MGVEGGIVPVIFEYSLSDPPHILFLFLFSSRTQMGKEATERALADAGVPYTAIEQACVGYVYGDSTCGQVRRRELGKPAEASGVARSISYISLPPNSFCACVCVSVRMYVSSIL